MRCTGGIHTCGHTYMNVLLVPNSNYYVPKKSPSNLRSARGVHTVDTFIGHVHI